MASCAKKLLLNKTLLKTTFASEAMLLENCAVDIVCFQKISNRTDGTFDGKVEHSSNGVDWFDLVTFTQKSADFAEIKVPTVPCLQYIRATMTVSAAPVTGADILIELNYRIDK